MYAIATFDRQFRTYDVPRVERALASELGLSDESVEARPGVTIGMEIRLFGVSPSTLLTFELRHALKDIVYLESDDSITVTYANRRRHLVQVSGRGCLCLHRLHPFLTRYWHFTRYSNDAGLWQCRTLLR